MPPVYIEVAPRPRRVSLNPPKSPEVTPWTGCFLLHAPTPRATPF